MKINKINILLISSVLIIGCSREQEKGNDDSSTNTAQSITNSDFSITNYSTYDNSSSSESGVVYQLNSDSSFYDNEPSSSSSSSSCAFFDAFSTATLEEDGVNTYKLAINDMSIADCFGSSSGITITSSKGSVYMYGVVIVDSSGNAIDVTGKTLSSACTSSCYFKSMAQAMYMSVSATSSQGDFELIIKQLTSESDDTACNWNSSSTYTSDCYQRYNSSAVGTDSTIALHKHIFKSGLDASSSGTYFTGGTITFQYNNWNGTMTYSSDSTSAAPTYSATNGTNSVSGTYNYSSSSSRSKRDNNLNTNLLDQQLINSFQNFVF